MPELELLQLQERFEASEKPYALATVIEVTGSASAKVGSKCFISADGKNLWGWVGGGCAESFTIGQALEALEEGVPRIITADLDDEIFGLGMPCGGKMNIYVEPRLPKERIPLPFRKSPASEALASHYQYTPLFQPGGPAAPEDPRALVLALAKAVASARGFKATGLSTRSSELPVQKSGLPIPSELLLLGHSRITQELAKLGALLAWPTRVYGIGLDPGLYPSTVRCSEVQADYAGLAVQPRSFVIVASHHKGDPHYIRAALESGAAYVGLVASPKRAGLVFQALEGDGFSKTRLKAVHSPTGLNLGCRNPGEIALSIVAELVELFQEGREPAHDAAI